MNKMRQMKFHILELALVLAMQPVSAFAQAKTIETNDQQTLSGVAEGPCVGWVQFSAMMHTVTRITTDANGGVHSTVQINVSHFQGVVLATGDKIQGSDEYNDTFNVNGPLPYVHNFVSTWNGQTQGSSDNLLFTEFGHVTVNANGTTTVSIDRVTLECRG